MPVQFEVAILAANAQGRAPPAASKRKPSSEGELALAKQLLIESS
jgi:hypothetical protein